MHMKLSTAAVIVFSGLAGSVLAAERASPYALEPCINGAVSASGLYPTQAEEDAALAEAARLAQAMTRKVSATER